MSLDVMGAGDVLVCENDGDAAEQKMRILGVYGRGIMREEN
jgi:hypothetical protein